MSKSSHEPGTAASNAQLTPPLGQDCCDGHQQNPSRRPPVPSAPRRAPSSSSLLTRLLLAPTPELDEDSIGRLIGPAADASPGRRRRQERQDSDITNGHSLQLSPGRLLPAAPDASDVDGAAISGQQQTQSPSTYWQDTNGAHEPGDSSAHTDPTMAATAVMRGSALSLGPSPLSTSPRIDMTDMSHVNSMLNSHRAFLNQHRGRGTSLERTHKERRVQTMPLESVSTNPGDTGMSRPSTPLNANDLTARDDSPLDGVRARYRSWRDARPGSIATEKAWSIGDDVGSDSLAEGQVEKSIADALAGIEPNSRSRKASHSLRFFKEGLPEEPKRKEKDRGRSKDQSQRVRDLVNTGAGSSVVVQKSNGRESSSSYREQYSGGGPLSRTVSGNSVTTISFKTTGITESTNNTSQASPVDAAMPPPQKLPQQLLDDLRKRHNLMPAPKKGYSFSKSMPVTDPSRQEAMGDQIEQEEQQNSNKIPARDIDESLVGETTPREEDEESGEEQISSALFVPHQSSREAKLRELERSSSETGTVDNDERESSVEPEAPEQWLVKHELPHLRTGDAISTPSPGHDLPPVLGDHVANNSDAEYFPDPQTPSDFGDTMSEADYMSRGYESTTDVEDTTPTGTLKAESHMTKDNQEHLHLHQSDAGPPAAIELIPYKHQVGGHTTMWRFSKRAVCKQLNNRENEFYEKVEKNHPNLLKFMPRYIGVLNVTFEKNKKKSKEETEAQSHQAGGAGDGHLTANSDAGHRIISQSMSNSAPELAPSVTIADNRHIIPKSFLPSIAAHSYANRGAVASEINLAGQRSQSQPPLPAVQPAVRPGLEERHANSWGATSVNRALRYEVFGEAFGQSIPVQKHKKPSQRSIPHRPGKGSRLRNSTSESNLSVTSDVQSAEESIRKKALKGAAERVSTTVVNGADTGNIPTSDDGTSAQFEDQAGTSAPDPDVSAPEIERQKAKKKRRYSSGALRRKPDEVAQARGNLKLFEEADEAGYRGDGEDDVFKMDPEPAVVSESKLAYPTTLRREGDPETSYVDEAPAAASISIPNPSTALDIAQPTSNSPPAEPPIELARPVNPNVARTQLDKRVEFFLLLEDLTAGMKRPCVMDLKMGTRQYGVDADCKKQKSQRKKCAETTSKELGVRVCGLQAWDVAKQDYIFQDKYFGRDLKAGQPFQNALTRFLFDGVSTDSIVRHIPSILTKLSKLEAQIRALSGYRFYAASLLLFYDAEGGANGGAKSDIDFKMADFANCITPETNLAEKACPPSHPDEPDWGFLRGLRSLRSYFSKIQKDVLSGGGRELAADVLEGEEDWEMPIEREDDMGEVSY